MGNQPEGKVSKKIIDAVNARGAYCWKVHGNEFTPAGTPDIVGPYRGFFVAFETKMPGNTLSPIQEYRIGKLREAGAFVVAPCFTVAQALELIDALDSNWDAVTPLSVLHERWGKNAGFPR